MKIFKNIFPVIKLIEIFFNFDSLTSVSINTSKMSIEKPRNLKLAPLSRGDLQKIKKFWSETNSYFTKERQ